MLAQIGGNWRPQDKGYAATCDRQARQPQLVRQGLVFYAAMDIISHVPRIGPLCSEEMEAWVCWDAAAYLLGQGQAGLWLSSSCSPACWSLWHLTGLSFSGILWHNHLFYTITGNRSTWLLINGSGYVSLIHREAKDWFMSFAHTQGQLNLMELTGAEGRS